jgi:hypothetical protein
MFVGPREPALVQADADGDAQYEESESHGDYLSPHSSVASSV